MGARTTGWCAVALAIAFNVPYALLAAWFDYPGILRRPAGDVLAAFAAGGPSLVVTWYAFFLCALAMVPLATALACAGADAPRAPGLSMGAAIAGALAGLTQAVGLSRWVFAVPDMARRHVDGATTDAARAAIETSFEVLNLWAGVAIGEHTGQILTCLWVGCMLAAERSRRGAPARVAQVAGLVAIGGIVFGLGEGIALALDAPAEIFSLGTISGYLAFSVWLVATGWGLVVQSRPVAP